MNAAGGEQAQEVHGVLSEGARDVSPSFVREQRAVRQRAVHQARALVDELASAKRVVANLAVAHIVFGRQADSGPVRAHCPPAAAGQARCAQAVYRRRVCGVHSVPLVLDFVLAPAVQDADQDRQAARDGRVRRQLPLGFNHGC